MAPGRGRGCTNNTFVGRKMNICPNQRRSLDPLSGNRNENAMSDGRARYVWSPFHDFSCVVLDYTLFRIFIDQSSLSDIRDQGPDASTAYRPLTAKILPTT